MWVVIAVFLPSALAMVAMRDNVDIDLTKFVTTEPAERVPADVQNCQNCGGG
jgi:hypothetical protein